MKLLMAYECKRVRADDVDYGDHIEHVVAKRSVTCRCCAEQIKKGEQAIKFVWDFGDSGSWTASTAYMHEACEPDHDPTGRLRDDLHPRRPAVQGSADRDLGLR